MFDEPDSMSLFQFFLLKLFLRSGVDPDWVNGAFETLGGFFILPSILKLAKDKRVAGVSWVHMAFFTSWGVWNLAYYDVLEQNLSWWGGLLLVLTNAAYLAQVVYYSKFPGGRA